MSKIKNILFTLLLVISLPLTLLASPIDFERGKKAYLSGNYPLAISYLRKSLAVDSDNITYKYYLGLTYMQIKDFKNAQNEFQEVIKKSSNSIEAKYSKIALVKMKDFIHNTLKPRWRSTDDTAKDGGVVETSSKADVGDNYIDKVTEKGDVIRWDNNSMPLKVYIEQNPKRVDFFNNEFVKAAKDGIEKWTDATDGLITFSFTSQPEEADIRITWKQILDTKLAGSEAGTKYTSGVTSPEYSQKRLSAMSIILTTTDPNGKQHDAKSISEVATHEMGHALGIMGHSTDVNDIMYPDGDAKGKLSSRDISTIKLLYTLDPDIYNITADKRKDSKIAKDNNVKYLGSKDDRLRNEIQAVTDAMKDNPKSDINHVNLGNLYGDKKDYDKAIREFKKAIQLNPKNDVAYLNLGSMYYSINKLYDALNAFKESRRLDPKKPTPYLNIAVVATDLNQKADAIASLREYLNLSPKSAKDPIVQDLVKKLGVTIQ